MKLFLGLGAAAMVAVMGAGCQPSNPAGAGNMVIFARGADSQKLDPHDVDDGESMKVLVNVCEGLVRFKAGTTDVEPCLAKSWQISPDGRTYTFQLRDGVRFHDGTPLDAQAAAFSFHRQMDKNHPGHLPEANFSYWGAMFSMVESVTASGRMELQFKLREPHAPLLASLAIPAASLISPTFINQRTPVGTGPFRFKEWIPNERIVLEANPHHWNTPPAFTTLIFKVVPDNATRLIQLQTGQVHAMDGLDPGDLPVVSKNARLRILSGPGLNVCYLALNTQRPPLQDKLVRRAIAAAINKPDVLTAVYRDAAVLARNPLPPFIAGHNDKTPSAHTKPDGVQPPAQSLTLHVMTNPRVYLPNPLRVAQLIKADLEKAGFKIEIVSNEWGAHLDRTQRGEHDLAILGWVGDTGDADNFLYVLLDKDTATVGSALNIAFWKHDPYHELMMAARQEIDSEKRAALYRQAQEMIFEECPMVPLAHAQNLVITRAEVENLLLQPNGDILFHRVSLPR